jgi:hypothetical protein
VLVPRRTAVVPWLALPLIAACGGDATPAATVTAAPLSIASTPTPAPTATPIPEPPIGDACVVGTWKVITGTIVVDFQTQKGAVVAAAVTGGSGMVEHLFSNGTVVEDLAGTAFTGSGGGYRVVVRTRGELRSPITFLSGSVALEPIDLSQAHATISVDGGAARTLPLANYVHLAYTCSGTSLTETDGSGEGYTYQRVSTTP